MSESFLLLVFFSFLFTFTFFFIFLIARISHPSFRILSTITSVSLFYSLYLCVMFERAKWIRNLPNIIGVETQHRQIYCFFKLRIEVWKSSSRTILGTGDYTSGLYDFLNRKLLKFRFEHPIGKFGRFLPSFDGRPVG